MKSLGLKLAAILCAVSLWFFVVSGKNYQMEMAVPLRIQNLPSILAISSPVPKTIPILLTGTGIELIRVRFQNLAYFGVDLSAATLGVQTVILDERLFHSEMKNIHPVVGMGAYTLDIAIDTRITQEVPIRLVGEIKPAKGYVMIGEPTTIPNTVSLSGARKTLTRVFEISSSPINLTNLKSTDTIDLPLSSDGLPSQIKLQTKSVKLAFQVQKRITKTFPKIPVHLVGPYERGVHSIEPEFVSLDVTGGKEMVQKLKPENIRLFLEFTRFEVEHSDSLAPTTVIDQPIESWTLTPAVVHLKEKRP